MRKVFAVGGLCWGVTAHRRTAHSVSAIVEPYSIEHVCAVCVCARRVAGRKGCDSIGGCPSLGGDRRVERSGVRPRSARRVRAAAVALAGFFSKFDWKTDASRHFRFREISVENRDPVGTLPPKKDLRAPRRVAAEPSLLARSSAHTPLATRNPHASPQRKHRRHSVAPWRGCAHPTAL